MKTAKYSSVRVWSLSLVTALVLIANAIRVQASPWLWGFSVFLMGITVVNSSEKK